MSSISPVNLDEMTDEQLDALGEGLANKDDQKPADQPNELRVPTPEYIANREAAIAHELEVQLQKERKRAERGNNPDGTKKTEMTEYEKRYRAMLNAPEKTEFTPEWFSAQLGQRMNAKAPIKITIHPEMVRQFIEIAYKHRVEGDNKLYQPDQALFNKMDDVAKWMTQSGQKNGLIFRGYCGVGKSTMARAICDVFSILEKRTVVEVSAMEIMQAGLNDKARFKEYCSTPMLFIDDLGTEPPSVRTYGNEISPMVELLTERHKRLLFTVITTNLIIKTDEKGNSVDQIEERYGPRVSDRLRELCNTFKYSGSRRSYR